MERDCALVSDLLTLYIEDLCSEETRHFVEGHLATCPDCRARYEGMTAPVAAERSSASGKTGEPQAEPAPALRAGRVLRRVRRRWWVSLLSVLLILPLAALSVGEVRGVGLSWSAIPILYRANAFVDALGEMNAEAAYALVDVEGVYEEYTTAENTGLADFSLDGYCYAEIGEEPCYLRGEAWALYEAAGAEENGALRFWVDYFSSKSSAWDDAILLPATAYALLADYYESHPEAEADLPGYLLSDFVPVSEQWPDYYCLPSLGVSGDLLGSAGLFDLLPEAVYLAAAEQAGATIEEGESAAQAYRDLGWAAFEELSWERFSGTWEALEEEGLEVTDCRLTEVYRLDNTWTVRYLARVTYGGESGAFWLELILSPDGVTGGGFRGAYPDTGTESELEYQLSWIYLVPLYYLPAE